MIIHWPQFFVLVIYAMSLANHAEDHGKPRTGTDNFFVAFVWAVIMLALLWCGGFFAGAAP